MGLQPRQPVAKSAEFDGKIEEGFVARAYSLPVEP